MIGIVFENEDEAITIYLDFGERSYLRMGNIFIKSDILILNK